MVSLLVTGGDLVTGASQWLQPWGLDSEAGLKAALICWLCQRGKSPSLSVPQFPQLYDEANLNT